MPLNHTLLQPWCSLCRAYKPDHRTTDFWLDNNFQMTSVLMQNWWWWELSKHIIVHRLNAFKVWLQLVSNCTVGLAEHPQLACYIEQTKCQLAGCCDKFHTFCWISCRELVYFTQVCTRLETWSSATNRDLLNVIVYFMFLSFFIADFRYVL